MTMRDTLVNIDRDSHLVIADYLARNAARIAAGQLDARTAAGEALDLLIDRNKGAQVAEDLHEEYGDACVYREVHPSREEFDDEWFPARLARLVEAASTAVQTREVSAIRPTAAQRDALRTGWQSPGHTSGSELLQLRTIAAMLRRGWITEPDGTHYAVTPAGARAAGVEGVPQTARRERETVLCETHPEVGPHFERDDCRHPHYTDTATRARMNAEAAR